MSNQETKREEFLRKKREYQAEYRKRANYAAQHRINQAKYAKSEKGKAQSKRYQEEMKAAMRLYRKMQKSVADGSV